MTTKTNVHKIAMVSTKETQITTSERLKAAIDGLAAAPMRREKCCFKCENSDKCMALTETHKECGKYGTRKCSFFMTKVEKKMREERARALCKERGVAFMKAYIKK